MSARVDLRDLTEVWNEKSGFGTFRAVSNNILGPAYIFTAFAFFVIAGIDSLVLRAQLAGPELELVEADKFNQLFTTHGTAMMFLFAVPMLEGIAITMIPLLTGAREMAFPRLSAFTYWTYLFGGLLFYSSTLPDIANFVLPGTPLPDVVPNVGWFSYPPLANAQYSPGVNIDFYLLGLGAAEIAGIAAAAEIVGSIFVLRAPGMSLDRMPLFVWAILVQAFAILIAFPAVLVASTFLELERKLSLPFFDPERGGDPLLWQHLFWFFGHPEVYIMLIPATGILSMIVATIAKRPIAGYGFIAAAIAGTGFMSFGLWVHHMFTVGLPFTVLAFFGAASMTITIPSGVQVFAWIATLWNAPRPRLTTPLLYVVGSLVTFVVGGVTGVMTASVPYDWQVHDTYFVVAHFHYVLIGGVVLPVLGGLVYWWPKLVGRAMDERAGQIAFWLIFAGFNAAFLPQHNVGLMGMPRRVYTYEAGLGWEPYNLVSTIGAFVMALGVLVFLIEAVRSVVRAQRAPADPWGGGTLEWATPSPPPSYQFEGAFSVETRDPLWNEGARAWVARETRDIRPGRTSHPGGKLWREALVTSALDARPVAVAVVAGPSYAPFALAVGVAVVSFALVFDLHALALAGTLASVPCAIWWMWPTPAERELAGAGRTLGSPALPVHVRGRLSVGWWATVIGAGAILVSLSLYVFSYLYLVHGAPRPPEVAPSPVALPALATAVALGAALAAWRADRAIVRARRGAALVGLVAAVALTVAHVAAIVALLATSGVDPRASAYGAIFWTFWGSQAALAAGVAIAAAVVLAQHALGYFDARRNQAFENIAILEATIALSGTVSFAVLTLSPYVLR